MMIRGNIFKRWNKKVYIASKTGSEVDENFNETTVYGTPIPYKMNIQPTNASSDLEAFGETSFSMMRAIVPYESYVGKINEFDVAYIYTTPEGEVKNGDNADYRVKSVAIQNLAIAIYFEKITK
jgi:hypothetical protein